MHWENAQSVRYLQSGSGCFLDDFAQASPKPRFVLDEFRVAEL
jgi:hypothetical protein